MKKRKREESKSQLPDKKSKKFSPLALSKLPDDCLGHTFSFFTIKELARFQRVNKKWKEIASQDFLWENMLALYSIKPEKNNNLSKQLLAITKYKDNSKFAADIEQNLIDISSEVNSDEDEQEDLIEETILETQKFFEQKQKEVGLSNIKTSLSILKESLEKKGSFKIGFFHFFEWLLFTLSPELVNHGLTLYQNKADFFLDKTNQTSALYRACYVFNFTFTDLSTDDVKLQNAEEIVYSLLKSIPENNNAEIQKAFDFLTIMMTSGAIYFPENSANIDNHADFAYNRILAKMLEHNAKWDTEGNWHHRVIKKEYDRYQEYINKQKVSNKL